MTPSQRDLVLACEIAGLLHDFGKLHRGFAQEKLEGGGLDLDSNWSANGIQNAHGAILESSAAYPSEEEQVEPVLARLLACMRSDAAWARVLQLPPDMAEANVVQMCGLGGPLRQHHAGNSFPAAELSFLGDLYTFGADWRDSALDKAAGGAVEVEQRTAFAEVANAVGHHSEAYDAETLDSLWRQAVAQAAGILIAPGATDDVAATRRALASALEPLFRRALGETRRPTNDVTLWHHCRSAASHYKAAVAEGMLRGTFAHLLDGNGRFRMSRLGRVRFRLLGIRWNWQELTARALRPVVLFSLAQARAAIVEGVTALVEEELGVGNVIYADDDGVLILAPGFFEPDDGAAADARFNECVIAPLRDQVDTLVARLGTGTPYRIAWSEPVLYLTDYREALSHPHEDRVEHRQADEQGLRAQWVRAPGARVRVQICPQCGLRPASAQEQDGSSLDDASLCRECSRLGDKTRAGREAKALRRAGALTAFGVEPETFNLQDLSRSRGGGNRRVVMISVRVDSDWIASGNALITQLARPAGSLKGNHDANGIARRLGDAMHSLRGGTFAIRGAELDDLRGLLGDRLWLSAKDGRAEDDDPAIRGLRVAEEFLLRESAPLTDPADSRAAALGLVRGDGDRLALFAMRRHASPARLARLWEDLRAGWKAVLAEVHAIVQGHVVPLSLDARGLSFIVAGPDADSALAAIQRHVALLFSKARGGFAPHVSAVAFRDKFPLYVALDALQRLESRIGAVPWQRWTLNRVEIVSDQVRRLHWNTADGEVVWDIDGATMDPSKPDRWLPHLVVLEHAGRKRSGPERLLHVAEIAAGDVALVQPATFDFANLETTARRHALRWTLSGDVLTRPHLVFGNAGRPAHHLEQYQIEAGTAAHSLGLRDLIGATGWKVSKLKSVLASLSETYGAWVRDVPAALRESGRASWLGFVSDTLAREVRGNDRAGLREGLAEAIANGRFFDACEWLDFIGGERGEEQPAPSTRRRRTNFDTDSAQPLPHA